MSHIDDLLSSTPIIIIYIIHSNTTTSNHFIPGKFRSLRSPSLRSSYGSLRSHYITTTNRPRFARTTVTTTTTLALLALATLDLASLVSSSLRSSVTTEAPLAVLFAVEPWCTRSQDSMRVRSAVGPHKIFSNLWNPYTTS